MNQIIIRMISCISLGLVFFLLNACLPIQSPEQRVIIAQCSTACEQKAKQCNTVCRNNCQQCQAYSIQSASESYLWYRHEQFVKCADVARELQSYRDPLQCRKSTCNCAADYQICVQACGGVVTKQLRSTPVCN